MRKPIAGPHPDLLRSLVKYDSQTGDLTWLKREPSCFKGGAASAENWNAKFVGQPAFKTTRDGYYCGSVFDRSYFAHRVAWALHFGYWPEGEIDHINGDRTDNRISNLRIADRSTQCRNRSLSDRNKSGVIGVCLVSDGNRWKAYINSGRRQINLGYFATKAEAVAARKQAERDLGYHPNHGRLAA